MRHALTLFISAALLIGALTQTTNGDSAGSSRELAELRSVIGGKDHVMTTLINPGNGPGRLVSQYEPGECLSARLFGNSMEPEYRDGDRVELNVIDVRDVESALGCDCMFRRHDGQATFKRLHAIKPDGTLVLRALNGAAIAKPLKVKRDELKLLAVARWICREAPSSAPRQEKSGTSRTPEAAQLASKSSKRKALATAA
jgi:hypothetical protein